MFKSFKILSVLLVSALLSQGLLADCCCPPTIINIDGTIVTLPYTIAQSNTTYCITKNLSFSGAAGAPAITVAPGVHDIIIDFNGYDLTLANSREVGINLGTPFPTAAQVVANVTIKNGTIQNVSPSPLTFTNTALQLAGFNGVHLENMIFKFTFNGASIINQTDTCIDLTVRGCQFNQTATGTVRGLSLATIQGLVVEDSIFLQPNGLTGATGIVMSNNAINVLIQRCSFNVGGSGISGTALTTNSLFQSSNFIINDCQIIQNNIMGGTGQAVGIKAFSVNNVQVTNTNISSGPNSLASLWFFQASNGGGAIITGPVHSGLLVDNCNFTISTAVQGTSIMILGNIAPVDTASPHGSLSKDVIIRQ